MTTPSSTLVVFHVAERCGAALSLRGRLEWLAERGRLVVATPGPGPTAEAYADIARTETLEFAAMTLPGPRALAGAFGERRAEVARMRALIRRTRPELVLSVTGMLPSALLAARLEGVPAIIHAAELLAGDPTRRPAARAGGWMQARLNARLSQGIAACSRAVAEEYAFSSKPLEVTYPAVSEPPSGDGGPMRARLGVPPGAPLIAALGSVSERRGQDVLVQAMHTVRKAIPDAHCAIFGDPFPRAADVGFHQDLTERVIDPRLADSVRLMPSTPDVGSVLAAADVVVNPARVAESFGRVACEALLARVPVVSSLVGAVPEVLTDGETGLLVPPGRPQALASAILALLRDRKRSTAIATRGRDDIQARFGPTTGLAEFQRLVHEVV